MHGELIQASKILPNLSQQRVEHEGNAFRHTLRRQTTIPESEPAVGVYREISSYSYDHCIGYNIYIGKRKSFGRVIDEEGFIAMAVPAGTLVTVNRIPRIWREQLDHHLEVRMKNEHDLTRIGYITYGISGPYFNPRYDNPDRHLAYTSSYEPRIAELSESRGLPYFLEALTTRDLCRLGATHVSTSHSPSPSRQKQLSRVGLPAKTAVVITEWYMGMVRGITESMRRFESPATLERASSRSPQAQTA